MKTINKVTIIRTPIYPFKDRVYDAVLKRLDQWTGNARNKVLFKEFSIHLAHKQDKKRRINKVIPELMKLSDWSGKDFDQLTISDIEQLGADIQGNSEWQEATKSDYMRALKAFFLWREDLDERLNCLDHEQRIAAAAVYKYVHKHVKTTYKHKEIDSSLILTPDDYTVLLASCRSPLEECVLAILFHTGVRVDELLNLRNMDIQIEDKCGMIRVFGKTGQRRIPILEAIPSVMKWLQSHPDRDNPDALLLVSLNNRYRYRPLRYMGVIRLLERVFERAGYLTREDRTEEQIAKKIKPRIRNQKKPCNPHWFRHSRATIWAKVYRESILCQLMGWVVGSDQARTYVHLGASQVKQAYLQANGIETEPNQTPDMIKCVCGALTVKTEKYCYSCYKPLTVEIAIADELEKRNAINEAIHFLAEMKNNPGRQQRYGDFENTLKEIQKK